MMKEVKTGTYFKGEESFNFEFYTKLSIVKKLEFVNSVTSLVVGDGNYNSVIRDLVFDFYLVDIFTTVNTVDLKISDHFLDDVEEFLEETNIVDIVKTNMEFGLLEELNKAVDLNIEYLTGIHTNPLNDALTSLVNTLERKINEVDLNSMMEMVSKFSGMTEEFTPENVVKAYLGSDVHKKNVEEIAEVKRQKDVITKKLDEAIKTVDGSKFNDGEKPKKTTKKSKTSEK